MRTKNLGGGWSGGGELYNASLSPPELFIL